MHHFEQCAQLTIRALQMNERTNERMEHKNAFLDRPKLAATRIEQCLKSNWYVSYLQPTQFSVQFIKMDWVMGFRVFANLKQQLPTDRLISV